VKLHFLEEEKTMFFSGSFSPRLGLFLTLSAFLSQFSPATLSAPPAQAPQTPLALTSQQQDQLRELVSRVFKHADKAGCKNNSCTILVVNFAGSTGSTSILGMQLADAVSAQMTAQANGIRIADRGRLQSYLEKERIPSTLLEEDNAGRWLAMENAANTVLVGYVKEEQTGIHLRVQLLDARELVRIANGKEKVGPIEDLTFANLSGNLEPAEPFGQLPGSDADYQAMKAASSKGVATTLPQTLRSPAPQYTDAARIAKFKGNLILQVTISADGRPLDVRVVRGLPFGLNRSSLETVRTWTFRPATSGGEPVQEQVPVEVTFRVY
jgi:TonB family protein